MLANVGRNTTKEGFTSGVLRHATNIATNQFHGVSSVTIEQAMAIVGLGRGAVDDSNKVICDDDAVLAFLRGILWDEGLLYNFHSCYCFWDIAR